MNLIRLASKRIWVDPDITSAMDSAPLPHFGVYLFCIVHNLYSKCILRVDFREKRDVFTVDIYGERTDVLAPLEYRVR